MAKRPKNPTICFRVHPDQIDMIKEFANVKGFHTASNLARKAMFIYIAQNSKGLNLEGVRDVSANSQGDSKKRL